MREVHLITGPLQLGKILVLPIDDGPDDSDPTRFLHHPPLMLLALNSTEDVEWEELQTKVRSPSSYTRTLSLSLSLPVFLRNLGRARRLHLIWRNRLDSSGIIWPPWPRTCLHRQVRRVLYKSYISFFITNKIFRTRANDVIEINLCHKIDLHRM